MGRGLQVRVADDAAVQRQARAFKPLDVRERAEGDHDHVMIQRGELGGRAQAQLDAVVAVQVRAARAQLGAEREHRLLGDVEQRDLEAELAGARCHFAADEAGADDRDGLRGRERGLERDRVVAVAQRVDVRGRLPRPGAGAGAGGDDQRLVLDRLVADRDGARGHVERGRRLAQAPLDVELLTREGPVSTVWRPSSTSFESGGRV